MDYGGEVRGPDPPPVDDTPERDRRSGVRVRRHQTHLVMASYTLINLKLNPNLL